MRVELFATDTAASFVQAFDIPPFLIPPGAIIWGSRTFVRVGEQVHRQGCAATSMSPPKPCNCESVWPYQETMVYAAMEMQQVVTSQTAPYRPVTRTAP